ncbi:hypothetical protein TKK_0002183 [Trichogramma kaykai]|uniref:Uncharacterized protein n=1 Tax=Trichogramma kaykai TaxID=54128 RepID=A0ABD2XBP4_9HYME
MVELTCWEKIAIVVVAAVGLRLFVKLSVVAWKKLIAPNLPGLAIDLPSQGKWAVVTGATDGLGKAFAQALANKGMNIVLVSRSLAKLQETAAEIKQAYGVEVQYVEADLTGGLPVYRKIGEAIKDLEIGVLVNNAGRSYDHPELFTHVDEETIYKIIQLNVAGLTGVARQVLPGMMERRRGVVINIGSAAGAMPSPYLAVYAASKMFVDKLSADLAAEAASRGVTVQCILPGPVATKMSKIRRATWMAPTPERFVEATLKTCGIEQRTSGYPPHSIILGTVNGLQSICERWAVWLVSRTMLNIRGRALRKKMKEAEGANGRDEAEQQPLEQ